MKKLRNKILSAVLVLSLLLTSSSFAFAVGEEGTTEEPVQEVKITRDEIASLTPSSQNNNTKDDEENIWCAFDGVNDDNKFWHTLWDGGSDSDVTTGKPRSVIVEFKDYQWVDKLVYYPRSGNGTAGTQNGRFEDCNIYTGDTIEDIKSNKRKLVGSGIDWENNADAKTIVLEEPVFTKYIMIEAPVTYGDDRDNNATSSSASALEIELYKDMSKYPTITEQPKSAVYAHGADIDTLTVSANSSASGNNVSYQWYESDTDDYNGTLIENTDSNSYTPTLNSDQTKYYYVKVTDNSTGASVYSDIVFVSMHNNSDNDVALVNGQYYNTLTEAINAVQDGGTVWIIDDIALTSNITINKDVNIKSVDNLIRTTQPFTIKRTTGNNGVMFTVETTGNLTLDNIILNGGSSEGLKGDALVLMKANDNNAAQLTIGSGAVLKNNNNNVQGGGAVQSDNANKIHTKIHVYGTIENNKTTSTNWNNGGAICTDGDLYIYDGAKITGNSAPVDNMGNQNKGGVGGAFQIHRNGSLFIYGGTITGNTSNVSSPNISFANNSASPMELSGNFNIENIDFNNVNNPIKIVDNVAENSSITIICNSITDGTKVAAIDEGVDTTNIVKAIKVDGKTTYRFGNDVKVGQAAAFTDGGLSETKTVMLNPNGNTSTTLTVETTGTDVTYEWYSCDADGNNAQLLETQTTNMLTLDNLEKGSLYYYCVIDNGDESTAKPKTSTTCEVKVTDFYPCSKAIEKFKSI